jgi:hypothetical protein
VFVRRRLARFVLFLRTLIMVRLEMGFRPKWFERNLIRQTKDDILRRLAGHDFGLLRIVLKKRDGRVAFQFFGDPNNVEKAKNLLGIC